MGRFNGVYFVLSISVFELAKYITAMVPAKPPKMIRTMIIARHDFILLNVMMCDGTSRSN